ncbi:hypothetical protein [Streptacidiphilus anmyonensis]|uniref:hypothetical protein n=1 Tax=Streptacidiphilus anmyonensis TaxID=405782 RepID=UPI0006948004|nr:hypothetical protein [Streptacidiphilus anmyonensis]
MNANDTARRPGAHLVAEGFGANDPWKLSTERQLRDLLDLVDGLVAETDRDVDDVHRELTRAAQSAIELLQPIANGDHASMHGWDGLLRTIRPQIELLAARHDGAAEQLARSAAASRPLQSAPDASQFPRASTTSSGKEQGTGRDDDWAISDDRQLRALEAIEAGGLRFRQSAMYGYAYLSNGTGQRPTPEVWPETVQRLVTDGLLAQDSSEGLYRPGQLLSLTPQGEAALRDARSASPRVSAALRRSGAAAMTGASANSAPTTTATPVINTPSRSR